MRWKQLTNFITAIILTLAFLITTLLNIIGPLHMDATGGMYEVGPLAVYSLIYLIVATIFIWSLYFFLHRKPRLLFFLLIGCGITIIILENFLWAWMGS